MTHPGNSEYVLVPREPTPEIRARFMQLAAGLLYEFDHGDVMELWAAFLDAALASAPQSVAGHDESWKDEAILRAAKVLARIEDRDFDTLPERASFPNGGRDQAHYLFVARALAASNLFTPPSVWMGRCATAEAEAERFKGLAEEHATRRVQAEGKLADTVICGPAPASLDEETIEAAAKVALEKGREYHEAAVGHAIAEAIRSLKSTPSLQGAYEPTTGEKLEAEEREMFRLADRLGYVCLPEPPHPDSPHAPDWINSVTELLERHFPSPEGRGSGTLTALADEPTTSTPAPHKVRE